MQAKLFMAIMYSDSEVYSKVKEMLKKEYGEIVLEGEEYDFNFTDYYLDEFGAELKKRFVLFEEIIETSTIVKIKLDLIKLEDSLSEQGKRIINIDPGYITSKEVIVPSTKPLPHRTPLDNGLVADKQLGFEEREVVTFRHTFADYRKHKEFFKDCFAQQ